MICRISPSFPTSWIMMMFVRCSCCRHCYFISLICLAILILLLCKSGLWYVAIIINNYYIFDASITLLRRIQTKQKPWKAHKEHFYQKAVQNGYSHSKVCKIIATHGILLICISCLTTLKPNLIIILFSIVISSLSTIYLLYYLNKKPLKVK